MLDNEGNDQVPRAASGFSRRSFLQFAGAGLGAAATPGLLAACTTHHSATTGAPHGIKGVKPLQLGAETRSILYPSGYVGPKARSVARIHDGSKTFRIVVPQNAEVIGDWNKNAFTKWLEARTGVKVEFDAILTNNPDGSQDLTKVNAMLASGDLPDAFLAIPFTTNEISVYGQQGVFIPLDDYIQTYAPQTRAAFTDYPDWRALTAASDNKLYQLKTLVDCFHCRISLARAFVNKKYVEAVGGVIPATTDDLRELLKLFKAKDPTPHHNIIPFAGSVFNTIDRYIMGSFLYNPGGDQNGGWLRLNNGKVEFVANTDEWRQALQFLRQLSDDGTIGTELFTMTDDALLAAGNQRRIGFARAYAWGLFIDVEYTGEQAWKDYVPVPPLKGPNGVQVAPWEYYNYNGGSSLIITKKCSNPEILVQWADAQMELEATLAGGLGPRSTGDFGWAKAGQKGMSGKQAIFYQTTYPPPVGKGWNSWSIGYQSNDFRLALAVDTHPSFEPALYEASVPYKRLAEPKEWQLPPVLFDSASAAQIADMAVSISSHVTQSMAKFATGQTDINNNGAWNSYVDAFKKIGLSNYLSLYQKAYDARPR